MRKMLRKQLIRLKLKEKLFGQLNLGAILSSKRSLKTRPPRQRLRRTRLIRLRTLRRRLTRPKLNDRGNGSGDKNDSGSEEGRVGRILPGRLATLFGRSGRDQGAFFPS